MIPGGSGRRVLGAVLGAVLVLASHDAIAADAPPRRFTPEDVFRLRSVGEVRISPDGRTVAYEALDTDIMIDGRRHAVRLVDVASGRDTLLAPDAQSPRWAPDSRAIAYVAGSRLVVASPAGGVARTVAELPTAPSAAEWSADGRMLAFTRFVPAPAPPAPPGPAQPAGARWAPPLRVLTAIRHDEDGSGAVAPGHTQLFVVPVAGGVPRQLTSGDREVDSGVAWLPDGRSLIVASRDLDRFGPGFRSGRLYRVPAAGGAAVAITPITLSAQSPAVSPDGRQVAFIAWAVDGRDFSPVRLRVMPTAGGASRVLDEPLDRDFSSVSWSGDGRALYAGYGDRSVDKVRRVALDGGADRDVASGLDGGFSVSVSGAVAYAAGRPDRPPDVAIVEPGATARLLTRRNEALLAGMTLGTTEPFTVRSSLDGATVGAWLTRPAGAVAGRRYPLILDIHGGPYGYDSPTWRTRDQLYAAAGYAVLHVNYRGSTSYGFAFADRIAADPLKPSAADLTSAVDAAVAAGIADPARLFVTGGSAGGELTAWIVGHTDRFRAAMAEKPIIDRTSEALTSDQYYVTKLIAGPPPWDDAARNWALSPLSAVGSVVTPTMLLVGEEDRRTRPSEALQFYHALLLRGVPTELVLVPGASHSTLGSKPSQLVAMTLLTLDWFGRYGEPGGGARKGAIGGVSSAADAATKPGLRKPSLP